MRIAVVNWSSRKAGGAESYLDRVIVELGAAGHDLALFCELDLPANRRPIRIPPGGATWCAARLGPAQAIDAMREWGPDLIYSHGLSDPALEALTLRIAAGIYLAHGYGGLCISGGKTFKFPVIKPCARRFGWGCLAHFYPHRCGGLNPITMWTDFRRQSRRLELLRSYRAVITASEHMRTQYLRQGLATQAVKVIPLPADGSAKAAVNPAEPGCESAQTNSGPHRLLFVGRMEMVKGGGLLLDAMPLVLAALGRGLRLTFVGDGTERDRLEAKAARLRAADPRLLVHFTGWLEGAQLAQVVGASDLLVVPSLWPEPFGLVGPEAGLQSLPAAAFAVGGIPEWLSDGVNGHLAPGDRPTAHGLAEAIIKCLRDSQRHSELRRGALRMAERFSLHNHMRQLMQLFESIVLEDYSAATVHAVPSQYAST